MPGKTLKCCFHLFFYVRVFWAWFFLPANLDKKTITQEVPLLSFGLTSIDSLFPGFQKGDFGVLYGSPECLWLSLFLCVHCQLPTDRASTGSPALFIDGWNTFDLYEVSSIAKKYNTQPQQALVVWGLRGLCLHSVLAPPMTSIKNSSQSKIQRLTTKREG